MRIVGTTRKPVRNLDTPGAAVFSSTALCHPAPPLHPLQTALYRAGPALQDQALQQDCRLAGQTVLYSEGTLEGGTRGRRKFGLLERVSRPLSERGIGGKTQTGASKEISSHPQLFIGR